MNRILPVRILSVATAFSLLAGCTEHELSATGEKTVALEISVLTSGSASTSRSIVNDIGTEAGKVGAIGVYLAAADGHSAYADAAVSSAIFSYTADSKWTASHAVNLQSREARLYAWYPVKTGEETAPLDNSGTRVVAVNVPASQTYDGQSATACSQDDYLYGSAQKTMGDATGIEVSATRNNPDIYLQHALAQVVFNLEYKPARLPDATYDYVKSISLQGPFRAGSGTMQLNDGTLNLTDRNAALTFTADNNQRLPGEVGKPVTVAYALVAPKTATTATVTMNMVLGQQNNTTYDRTLSVSTNLFDAVWEKGNRYIYHILLDKNDLSFKEVTIKGWQEVNDNSQGMIPDWE